jgi:hypothetical protein
MTAVVLIAVLTVVVAILTAVLVPGLGFIMALAVVALGIAVITWLLRAGASGRAPSELARDVPEHEFLGPGGPDDPNR